MLNKIHEILKDKDCSGNIRCFTWAFVCVMVYFSVFLYGFGILGLSQDIRNINVEAQIKLWNEFETQKIEFEKQLFAQKIQIENHRHKLFSGKIFFPE